MASHAFRLLLTFFPFLSACPPDTDVLRARKRQRTEARNTSTSTTIDQHSHSARASMRIADSDRDSDLSVSTDYMSHAGPSNTGSDRANGHASANGHTTSSNGFVPSMLNGSFGPGAAAANGAGKHGKAIARVHLPGTTLYDDSYVDREEFVRLVIQSLRDVGYMYALSTFNLAEPHPRVTANPPQPWKLNQAMSWRHLRSRTLGSTFLKDHGSKQRLLCCAWGSTKRREYGYASLSARPYP